MGFLTGFFLRDAFHSRRTLWMFILGLVPAGCAVLLMIIRPMLSDQGVTVFSFFRHVNFLLYLHFLLPILSVFIGAAVIGDEVEERTLPYLLTRPVPRWSVALSKTAAGIIASGAILVVSLFITYSVMAGVDGRWGEDFALFLQSAGALLLGLAVYLPLFGVLGGLLKRPVLAGLLFTFGWESSVSFFPGNVKLMTLAHYLHVLYPPLEKVGSGQIPSKLFSMVLPTKALSPGLAISVLLGLSFVFAAVLGALLYVREYRLEQE